MDQPSRTLRHRDHDSLLLGLPMRVLRPLFRVDAKNYARENYRLGQNRDRRGMTRKEDRLHTHQRQGKFIDLLLSFLNKKLTQN